MNRRRFIQSALAASAISALRLPDIRGGRPVSAPKKVLVLGGTNFLGPAVVEGAVVAGHTVTLFNCGITNPELFPRLEKLRGFRSSTASEENCAALGSRTWDAVIDVWPSDTALAESAATLLRDRVSHYLHVSSIAAYDSLGLNWASESDWGAEGWEAPEAGLESSITPPRVRAGSRPSRAAARRRARAARRRASCTPG